MHILLLLILNSHYSIIGKKEESHSIFPATHNFQLCVTRLYKSSPKPNPRDTSPICRMCWSSHLVFGGNGWCSWSWSSQERSWTPVSTEPPSWWHPPQGFLGNDHCKADAPPSECQLWIDRTGEPWTNTVEENKDKKQQQGESKNLIKTNKV